MPDAPLRRKAFQILLLCTVFWAFSFPAMKTLAMIQQRAVPEAGSWFFTSLCVTLRFLISGLLLLAVSPRQLKTLTRLELEQGLCLAVCVSGGISLQMDGLAYTSTSTSAFLTQLYCVLIPIWVAVSRRLLPTVKIVVCSVLVLIGMAVLVQLNPLAIRLGRGELETLACSVMFTAQILCLERPRYAANRPDQFTTVMLLGSALLMTPLVIATAPNAVAVFRAYDSAPALVIITVLIFFCTITPFLLMNRWQREVTATEAGLVYCVEPVVVSIIAVFLPGWLSQWTGVNYANEPLTVPLLVGGGLITVANILLQLRWLEPKTVVRE